MPDISVLLPFVGFLLVVGGFAGVLAGLLGVGGGIVLVPAFYFVFQQLGYTGPQLMQVCVATSLATIIVTSLRSVRAHHGKGAVSWQTLRTWAPGIVMGAATSVLVANQLRSDTMVIIFACLALSVAAYMGLSKDHWRLADAMPQGVRRVVMSIGVGFLSVLMGIGGGGIAVPLMKLHGRPMHSAVGTAAGFGLLIAVPGAIGFLLSPAGAGAPPGTVGLVNLPAFAIIVAMTTITTPIGVNLAHKLNPSVLKRVFAAFLFLVALNMIRRAIMG
ncbi:membrane protein [Thalassobacter stenotrophicus]|uniref:sulfite exporter TauE/SafE family protein n=1 Tax=Thalassobacter TaxID=266808 RepID=UPI00051FB3B8|nr:MULTISPECIES: sulfite exporter TauE/SafE family protein [Thalassobacter]KGK79892.1 membrane protein [Thalassobacter stenotrophicus]